MRWAFGALLHHSNYPVSQNQMAGEKKLGRISEETPV